MGTKWLPIIADLFRPEHSLGFSCETCTPVPRAHLDGPSVLVSIKALFWVAVSIAAGLILGQLR